MYNFPVWRSRVIDWQSVNNVFLAEVIQTGKELYRYNFIAAFLSKMSFIVFVVALFCLQG